jgi:hypothetical protein
MEYSRPIVATITHPLLLRDRFFSAVPTPAAWL